MSGKLRLFLICICIVVGVMAADMMDKLPLKWRTPTVAIHTHDDTTSSTTPSQPPEPASRESSQSSSHRSRTGEVQRPATIVRPQSDGDVPLRHIPARLSSQFEIPASVEQKSAIPDPTAEISNSVQPPASPTDILPPENGSIESVSAADRLATTAESPPQSQSRFLPPPEFGRASGFDKAQGSAGAPRRLVLTEPGSFWAISEQYYGSGGYFKALYVHNRERIARPDKLGPGDTIEVPTLDELRSLYPQYCPITSNQLRTAPPAPVMRK